MKKAESLGGKGVFYVMPKQAFSNETIVNALRELNLSTELTHFKYKGKSLPGWLVNADFIQMLYGGKVSFPKLNFSIFVDNGSSIKRFRLMEPAVKLKARAKRHLQAKNKGRAKMI